MEKDTEVYLRTQGLRIRHARRILDMTQPELAEKLSAELGVKFGDDVKVSRIEKGKQDVTGRELAALSAVLSQPAAWLQGLEDNTLGDAHNPRNDADPEWAYRPMEDWVERGRLGRRITEDRRVKVAA